MNGMKEYIGTKIVQAEPALRFQLLSGEMRIVPYDQIHEYGPVDAVACEDGYKVVYQDGYESWSPKDVFEAAYRPTSGMNFGLAIEAAKMGKKIARHGWNGKRQYVELATGISYANNAGEVINAEHAAIGNKALVFVGTSGVQMGWLASQSDMLADDWYIVSHGTTEVDTNQIYNICLLVNQMTDAEVQELSEIARGQMEYHNPLKMATTARQHALGRHNQAVLDALLNLKAVIESGKDI